MSVDKGQLGPFHMDNSVASNRSVSDREYVASSEGCHMVDCLRKESHRQKNCRLPCFSS